MRIEFLQRVSLGVTQSGKPGLFTCGYLAWPITTEEYEKFSTDRTALAVFVERCGFALQETQPMVRPAVASIGVQAAA